MEYLADTVALIRHLNKHPKLGVEAKRILNQADQGLHRIYISGISLMEILYSAEAKRITLNLAELIRVVQSSQNYTIVPVDANVVLAAALVTDVPELHDRMIVGTASYLGVPIITSDLVIGASRFVKVVW